MPESILIVDDEADVLSALTRLLRAPDRSIHTASSGQEALALIGRESRIDLVITDMRMPGMHGDELLRRLPDRSIRRMVLTGFADLQRTLDVVNETGVDRFFMKPWDNTELKDSVTQALAGREIHSTDQDVVNELRDELQQVQAKAERASHLLSFSADLIKESRSTALEQATVTLAEHRIPRKKALLPKVIRRARLLGESVGLQSDQLSLLNSAAKVHRIGELALPLAIVGRCYLSLTPLQLSQYLRYPAIGAALIEDDAVSRVVLQHRASDEITVPMTTRVLGIATVFEEVCLFARNPADEAVMLKRAAATRDRNMRTVWKALIAMRTEERLCIRS
jgi:response regulator RpfG family c-di-GMP phosphodiesterase